MSFVENRFAVAGKIRTMGGASFGEGAPPFQLEGSLQRRVGLPGIPVPVQVWVPALADFASNAAASRPIHKRVNTGLSNKEQNVVFMVPQ